MLELLIFVAGAATGAVAVMLPYNRTLTERDLLQATKDSLAIDVEALKARANTLRANTLRGDNAALGKRVQTLTSELVEAARKLDRIEAAQRAAKPSRGPDGKFLPKAQA